MFVKANQCVLMGNGNGVACEWMGSENFSLPRYIGLAPMYPRRANGYGALLWLNEQTVNLAASSQTAVELAWSSQSLLELCSQSMEGWLDPALATSNSFISNRNEFQYVRCVLNSYKLAAA